MICAARLDADPAAVTCSAALGVRSGALLCVCGIAVEAELKAAETRTVRVPDSARAEEIA